jgi:hypothetical protein
VAAKWSSFRKPRVLYRNLTTRVEPPKTENSIYYLLLPTLASITGLSDPLPLIRVNFWAGHDTLSSMSYAIATCAYPKGVGGTDPEWDGSDEGSDEGNTKRL